MNIELKFGDLVKCQSKGYKISDSKLEYLR